jgi:hypothetical protein
MLPQRRRLLADGLVSLFTAAHAHESAAEGRGYSVPAESLSASAIAHKLSTSIAAPCLATSPG